MITKLIVMTEVQGEACVLQRVYMNLSISSLSHGALLGQNKRGACYGLPAFIISVSMYV